jgi:hypothetical protein
VVLKCEDKTKPVINQLMKLSKKIICLTMAQQPRLRSLFCGPNQLLSRCDDREHSLIDSFDLWQSLVVMATDLVACVRIAPTPEVEWSFTNTFNLICNMFAEIDDNGMRHPLDGKDAADALYLTGFTFKVVQDLNYHFSIFCLILCSLQDFARDSLTYGAQCRTAWAELYESRIFSDVTLLIGEEEVSALLAELLWAIALHCIPCIFIFCLLCHKFILEALLDSPFHDVQILL